MTKHVPTTGYYVMYDEHGEALWKSEPMMIEVSLDGDRLLIDTDPKLNIPRGLPASLTWLVKDRDRLMVENDELRAALERSKEALAMVRSAVRDA